MLNTVRGDVNINYWWTPMFKTVRGTANITCGYLMFKTTRGYLMFKTVRFALNINYWWIPYA